MSVAKSTVWLNVSKVAASVLAASLLLTACSNGEHHEAVPLSETLEEAAELAHANAPEPIEYDFEVTEMPVNTDTEATAVVGTDAEATAAGIETDNAETATTTSDMATTDTASAVTDTAASAPTTASTTSDSAGEAVAQ